MNKFEIIKVLGQGSFGRALLCRDEKKAFVVVKEVKVESSSALAEAEKESTMLQRHSHSNIVRYIAAFADRPRRKFYLVMEYADGGDLAMAISRRRKRPEFWAESEAMLIFVQCLLAVRHVHARRIVHRDIKAANVFLTRQGVVKLGDFGVSKALEKHTGAQTELVKTQVGTPYYLAPEIFEGKPYARKADVWSLGILFYEVLALRMPFDAPSLAALCRKVTSGQLPNQQPLNRYSPDARTLCGALLRHNAEKRPGCDDLLTQKYVRSHMAKQLSQTLDGGALALSVDARMAAEQRQKEQAERDAQGKRRLAVQREAREVAEEKRRKEARDKEQKQRDAARAERMRIDKERRAASSRAEWDRKAAEAQARLADRPDWQGNHLAKQEADDDEDRRLEEVCFGVTQDDLVDSGEKKPDPTGLDYDDWAIDDDDDSGAPPVGAAAEIFPSELQDEYARCREEEDRNILDDDDDLSGFEAALAGRDQDDDRFSHVEARHQPEPRANPTAAEQYWQNREHVRAAKARERDESRGNNAPAAEDVAYGRGRAARKSREEEDLSAKERAEIFKNEARQQFMENRSKRDEMAARHKAEIAAVVHKPRTPDPFRAHRVRESENTKKDAERAAYETELRKERQRIKDLKSQMASSGTNVGPQLLEFDMRPGDGNSRNGTGTTLSARGPPARLRSVSRDRSSARASNDRPQDHLAASPTSSRRPRPSRQPSASSVATGVTVDDPAAAVAPTTTTTTTTTSADANTSAQPRRRRRRWNTESGAEVSTDDERSQYKRAASDSANNSDSDTSAALDEMWDSVAKAKQAVNKNVHRRVRSSKVERRRPPTDGVAALNAALQDALDDDAANTSPTKPDGAI